MELQDYNRDYTPPLRKRIGSTLQGICLLILVGTFNWFTVITIIIWLITYALGYRYMPFTDIVSPLFIGIVVVLLVVGILLSWKKNKLKKESEKINNIYLKTYGQKIKVDIYKCEIIESKNIEPRTTLVYQYSSDNMVEKFISQALPYDRNNLFEKIQENNEAIIYVDRKNRHKYFFDIDFLIY